MFLTNVGLVPIPDQPDLWFLDGPLVWQDERIRITVPKGFISDDASTPKFLDFVPFLDRQGLSRRPGLAHDAMYSLGRIMGKDFADLMLEQFCLAEKMKPWQAHSYYLGVHWFGASSWAQDAGHGLVNPATGGDFFDEADYTAFVASGSTIFTFPPNLPTAIDPLRVLK